MADLDELQKKQAATVRLAMTMVDEKDPEKLKEITEQIQAKCKELEKMAKGIEAALTPPVTEGQEVRVMLTPAQKARITEQTGIGVEMVLLRDTNKKPWSKEMPRIEPREIEKMAAKQAAETKLIIETRKEVEKIVKELEALNVPEIADTLAELRKDPTLGLGKKKPK